MKISASPSPDTVSWKDLTMKTFVGNKDIYAKIPFVTNIGDGRAMLDAVRRHKRIKGINDIDHLITKPYHVSGKLT